MATELQKKGDNHYDMAIAPDHACEVETKLLQTATLSTLLEDCWSAAI